MSIAGRINAVLITILLLAGSLATFYVAESAYASHRLSVLQQFSTRILTEHRLPLAIYYSDMASLDDILGEFLSPAENHYGAVYDAGGTRLAQRIKSGSTILELPRLEVARQGVPQLEQGLIQRASEPVSADYRWLSAITGGEQLIDLSAPIFSLVDPQNKNLSRSDFGMALTAPESVGSLHLIGYIHVGISRTAILATVVPLVLKTLLLSLLFSLASVTFVYYITRRVTRPMSRLVHLANSLATGDTADTKEMNDDVEASQIESTLATVIGSINTYKSKVSADHQLLSMKVEERTAQLSLRNEDLNKAVKEVTETKDRLREMAYFDSLTALPNRRLFYEQLNLLLRLTLRNKGMLALLFLDLDNFKRINDSLGHGAGDQLLKKIAVRLEDCVRDSDLVAHYIDSGAKIDVSRLGGDEFTVVLNHIDSAESAGMVAQRILDALSEPITLEEHELVVSPSIGITMAPTDADNVDDLIKAADTAMYHAKKSGGNSYMYYHADMDTAGIERLELESDLRKALERNELELYYQPQVDYKSGTTVGAEALVRWNHPTRGMVSPAKFIPLAEETGLIVELGGWVLEQACSQIAKFRAQDINLPKVSVNVSAIQFNQAFIKQVAQVLRETGLPPSSLELELTEGVILENSEETIDALHELKALGVSLSIDDFGTGYSSLSYLSQFPLDELKIDRSFVVAAEESENSANLVVAIIAMGQSLNLKLVAEGVETPEQLQFLTSNGAYVIQGYLFSKPVEAEALKPLLRPNYFKNTIRDIERKLEKEQRNKIG